MVVGVGSLSGSRTLHVSKILDQRFCLAHLFILQFDGCTSTLEISSKVLASLTRELEWESSSQGSQRGVQLPHGHQETIAQEASARNSKQRSVRLRSSEELCKEEPHKGRCPNLMTGAMS